MEDFLTFMTQWWEKTLEGFTRSGPLSVEPWLVIVIVVAAIALSVPKVTWRYFGLFVTVVHELGHAFAALMTGQLVTGIKINKDQSGATHSMGRGGIRAVWSGFWGYPTPAVVGAALIWAAINGWSSAALSIGTIVIALTLLFIRNLYGVLVILGCAAASWLMAWYAPGVMLGYVTLVLGVALIVGGVRDWINVASVHIVRRNEVSSSDAYILFKQTMIPSPVWLLGFGAVVLYSAWFTVQGFLTMA